MCISNKPYLLLLYRSSQGTFCIPHFVLLIQNIFHPSFPSPSSRAEISHVFGRLMPLDTMWKYYSHQHIHKMQKSKEASYLISMFAVIFISHITGCSLKKISMFNFCNANFENVLIPEIFLGIKRMNICIYFMDE